MPAAGGSLANSRQKAPIDVSELWLDAATCAGGWAPGCVIGCSTIPCGIAISFFRPFGSSTLTRKASPVDEPVATSDTGAVAAFARVPFCGASSTTTVPGARSMVRERLAKWPPPRSHAASARGIARRAPGTRDAESSRASWRSSALKACITVDMALNL